MNIENKIQSIYDNLRPNRYGLKKYLIKDNKKHPFAIICPGGAYGKVCSYVEGMPIAKELNKLGYHAFVVYYRTNEKAIYPNPHEDLYKGISEVLNNKDKWNLDTDKWSLWGFSAGGHLVSSYCTLDYDLKPEVLVLSYPVITLKEYTHKGTLKNLLGINPDLELIERLSVENNVKEDYPPTFIWNGDADKSIDPINSKMMVKALNLSGIKYEYREYENVGHGVGLAKGTNAENWLNEALDFISKL
ncbi:MAG: alpha/beta hydrolase [Erysipelotrichaceae bacterium]|nr:alpha/beta hydrolase [Erysipelotrichaceae bacterium]